MARRAAKRAAKARRASPRLTRTSHTLSTEGPRGCHDKAVSTSLRLAQKAPPGLNVLSKDGSAGPGGYPPSRASYPRPSHAPRCATAWEARVIDPVLHGLTT